MFFLTFFKQKLKKVFWQPGQKQSELNLIADQFLIGNQVDKMSKINKRPVPNYDRVYKFFPKYE